MSLADDSSFTVMPMAQGRRAVDVELTVVRQLTAADIAIIGSGELTAVAPLPTIQSLRVQHHRIAALLAKGASLAEVNLATGYSPSWVSSLQKEPDFADLVAYYRDAQLELLKVAQEKLTLAGITALELLQSKMDSKPEAFSNREMMELAEMAVAKQLIAAKAVEGQRAAASGQPAVRFNVQFVQQTPADTAIDITPAGLAKRDMEDFIG